MANDDVELFRQVGDMERRKELDKEFVKRNREQSQADMAGMRSTAMAVLNQLLLHEDPAVQIKALSLWMTKMVPTVASEKVNDEDVIDATVGPGFDELAAQIEKLKKGES